MYTKLCFSVTEAQAWQYLAWRYEAVLYLGVHLPASDWWIRQAVISVSGSVLLIRRTRQEEFQTRRTRRHALPPTTSTQPILDACGPFWSRSGRDAPSPLTGNEGESCHCIAQ